MGLVDAIAALGDFALSSYNFQLADVYQASVYVNGDPIPYKSVLIRNADYRDGYLSLLETTGYLFRNDRPSFTSTSWPSGFALYGFQLEPDHPDGSCTSLRKSGVVEISIQFSKATTKSYSIIVYSTRDSVVEIDSRRNVFLPLKRL